MARIVLVIEYDGSRYCGWQKQLTAPSIQTTVEAALSQIAQEEIRIVAAGRTDSGVHALCQVVHFDTNACRPISAWIRGVNALLPDDIAIRWASEMAEDFHARYSALERRYLYLLVNRPVRPGIFHHRIGWYHHPLALEQMQEASCHLIGEHNFSSFRSAECQAKSPIRTITQLSITRYEDLIVFDVRANAFLHHMVRNIIGSLVYVGKGKHPPIWIYELLLSCNRVHAAPTFLSEGLYLSGVRYDAHWGIPEFAEFPVIPGVFMGYNRS